MLLIKVFAQKKCFKCHRESEVCSWINGRKNSDLCFSIHYTLLKPKLVASVTYSMSIRTGLDFYLWLLWPFCPNVRASDAGVRWQQIISNQRIIRTMEYISPFIQRHRFDPTWIFLKVIFCRLTDIQAIWHYILLKYTFIIHCLTVTQTFKKKNEQAILWQRLKKHPSTCLKF